VLRDFHDEITGTPSDFMFRQQIHVNIIRFNINIITDDTFRDSIYTFKRLKSITVGNFKRSAILFLEL